MEIDQWVEIIKSIMGSKEVIQVVLQGAEYSIQRSDAGVLSHFGASLRRWREGIPHPFWESIGGIVYNLATNEMTPAMQDVPSELYNRAVGLAESRSIPGRLPAFDQKVLSPQWTYRMVAVQEGPAHALVFYRRPKRWPWIII